MTTCLRKLRFGNCLLKLVVRNAATTSAVPSLRSSLPRAGSQDAGLWDVLEYNSHYFNAHRMAPLLEQVLEQPRSEARGDARLHAYLQKAIASCQLYYNLQVITCKETAAAITFCRQVGHPAAEELSDVIVATVSEELARLDMRRVSFYITAFAKYNIEDSRFWKSAARVVANTSEPMSSQVLVSLMDAFRKSGVKQERPYQALARRAQQAASSFEPELIPPMLATICRVPLPMEDREEALRVLLTQWLLRLRKEKENPTGAISVQQILSLAVSLGLNPELVNTAVFARDVAAYLSNRFDLLRTEELIVFLWAFRRLVLSQSSTAFLSKGLHKVHQQWRLLVASAELSVQRLVQLSDVLSCVKAEAKRMAPYWTDQLEELQELVIQDLTESVQYCQPETLAEILEMWAGTQEFWQSHCDFAQAITKRMEELLLECIDLQEVVGLLQAALAAPGLISTLPPRGVKALQAAVLTRNEADVERVQAIFAGSTWEVLCQGAPATDRSGTTSTADNSSTAEDKASKFQALLSTWQQPRTDLELVHFLRDATTLCNEPVEALQALEAAAPFAERLAAGATAEVLQLLEKLCQSIAQAAPDLTADQLGGALQACAVAGLPHAPLFSAALDCMTETGATRAVEVLESCAKLRLALPELMPWLRMLRAEGAGRQLSANGLARLLAAAARLGIVEAPEVDHILKRLLTVASPIRPMSPETIAAVCLGLTLTSWTPRAGQSDLWEVARWLRSSKRAQESQAPLHATVLRNFVLRLLMSPSSREAASELSPELQEVMVDVLCSASAQRRVVSDTTLKFRHEAAEVLRKAGRPYDLDIGLGPAFIDLALPGNDGAFWLLDGPEAFQRPFQHGKAALNLVPAEVFRSQMLLAFLDPSALSEMEAALKSWSRNGTSIPHFGLQAQTGRFPWIDREGDARLARLDWLEWERDRKSVV